MITILLVDDQALLCEMLKTWLDVEKDINVLGVAHNGQEAIAKVEQLQPDMVLMDIDMPQMDGLQATKIISQRFPKVKVIFLKDGDRTKLIEVFEAEDFNTAELQRTGWQAILENFKKYVESNV